MIEKCWRCGFYRNDKTKDKMRHLTFFKGVGYECSDCSVLISIGLGTKYYDKEVSNTEEQAIKERYGIKV